jgi:SAM-dependent methyltransferase
VKVRGTGSEDGSTAGPFLHNVLDELRVRSTSQVLDFGCGAGRLVSALGEYGYAASGCDVVAAWNDDADPRFRQIELAPYRLPFDDASFDVVVSTSVLEHAQNKDEIFAEIHRVLRPGGLMFHIYPAKWYLPSEPHIFVPLVNWMWPHVPRLWLALWARLGVRNTYQTELTWRDVVGINAAYCRDGLSYWSGRRYRASVERVFGNCSFPQGLYVRHSEGRAAELARRLSFGGVAAWLLGKFRMTVVLARRADA